MLSNRKVIVELAEKSDCEPRLMGSGATRHMRAEGNLERFAENLINECLAVMDATAARAKAEFTCMDDDVPTSAHQFAIRQHFGLSDGSSEVAASTQGAPDATD